MRRIFTICLSIALAMFTVNANANEKVADIEYSYSNEQASLSISNRSEYTLTIKIMRNNGGGLYSIVSIPARSSRTVYFSDSGSFYTKLKAEKGLETIYKQDAPFSIQCDNYGYTEASMSYYISSTGGSAGKSISRSEFEKNY
jgi:hypothetical protein